MVNKKIFLRIFFTAEVCAFSYVYMCGANSINVLVGLQRENKALELQLGESRNEIASLSVEIDDWKHNTFNKEKVAREELQMARAQEQVFYRLVP